MVGGGERLDHRTTKIGGVPDWPQAAAAECEKVGGSDACSSPPPEMTVCAQCGCTMALVTQAHAPLVSGELLNGTAVADRVLYLFTCFSNTCPRANTNAGRWRCLRAQAPLVHTATLANDPYVAAGPTSDDKTHRTVGMGVFDVMLRTDSTRSGAFVHTGRSVERSINHPAAWVRPVWLVGVV